MTMICKNCGYAIGIKKYTTFDLNYDVVEYYHVNRDNIFTALSPNKMCRAPVPDKKMIL